MECENAAFARDDWFAHAFYIVNGTLMPFAQEACRVPRLARDALFAVVLGMAVLGVVSQSFALNKLESEKQTADSNLKKKNAGTTSLRRKKTALGSLYKLGILQCTLMGSHVAALFSAGRVSRMSVITLGIGSITTVFFLANLLLVILLPLLKAMQISKDVEAAYRKKCRLLAVNIPFQLAVLIAQLVVFESDPILFNHLNVVSNDLIAVSAGLLLVICLGTMVHARALVNRVKALELEMVDTRTSSAVLTNLRIREWLKRLEIILKCFIAASVYLQLVLISVRILCFDKLARLVSD